MSLVNLREILKSVVESKMPNLECRVARLEGKISEIEVDVATIKEKIDGVSEVLQERRRQADHIVDTLDEIKEQISILNMKLFGYKNTAIAILKTTITMTTFFSAVGAAIWALVTLVFNEVKK